MAKIRVLGHRRTLDDVLAVLHGSQRVHLIDVTQDASVTLPPLSLDDTHRRRIEDLRYLRTRLDALLRLMPDVPDRLAADDTPIDLDVVRAEVEDAGPRIEKLVSRLDRLRQELDTLPRHLESLRRLLPLVPDMADLDAYETAALLIDARHGAVLAELNDRLFEQLGGNFELISDRVGARDIGAILIYPRKEADTVRKEFGREQVTRVRLPERYESIPFRDAISAMERRLAELPTEIEVAEADVADVVRQYPHWAAARTAVQAQLDQLSAIRRLGATPHTFSLSGWVPEADVDTLRHDLETKVGDEVVVERVEIGPEDAPPVLLENPSIPASFESFVRLLDIPRARTLDPSLLMAVFLPLFFGMMLGDVAYGVILLGLALLARHRLETPGMLRDLARILELGAGWTIVWGFVYGEFLGDLGHRLGMQPLWVNREDAVQSLLLLSIAIGAGHVLLGLAIGVWQARRIGDMHKLGERIGMIVGLIALFAIAGAAMGMIPDGLLTPAVALAVVGLVIVVSSGGVLGLLMGPLEFIGTIGNVLSYLRIAAIGLASVYLARVANELGAAAPLWLGIAIAALFHALNLVLGVFSPTIQALRLHYVEFFGKFFEGGGEAFQPFGEERSDIRPTTPQR
jgi:V/A-type H+-transporting ATPase subunit I